MPTLLVISNHSPEYRPKNNETVRKATLDALSKVEELLKKHSVKLIGTWFGFVSTEHTYYMVFEAPSLEAFQKFRTEPEFLTASKYDSQETKIVKSLEEIGNELKQL